MLLNKVSVFIILPNLDTFLTDYIHLLDCKSLGLEWFGFKVFWLVWVVFSGCIFLCIIHEHISDVLIISSVNTLCLLSGFIVLKLPFAYFTCL